VHNGLRCKNNDNTGCTTGWKDGGLVDLEPSSPVSEPPKSKPPKKSKPSSPPTQPAAAGTVSFQAGDSALGVKGKKVAPVVTKEGTRAYQVVYQANKIHPGGANMSADIVPKQVFPSEECRVSLKVFFDPDFPWIPNQGAAGSRIGGKLVGFDLGHGAASGGNYSKTGGSIRLVFSPQGGITPYLYPQVKNPRSRKGGDVIKESDVDQNADFWKVASITSAGTHMFRARKDDPPLIAFQRGKWNDISMYVKLNTPGKYDGIIEVTVNGKSLRFDEMRYRYDSSVKIEAFGIHTFFGGGDNDYAPKKQITNWFGDFKFSPR
jgi:hypothetical protein